MTLLVTNRRDVTTDFVVAALRRRDSPYVRFNTEDLLRTWRVTWTTSGWRAVTDAVESSNRVRSPGCTTDGRARRIR